MRRALRAQTTVRGTLFVLIAITLAPLLGFGVYEVADDYRDQRDAEVRASGELARAVAGGFEAFVQSLVRAEHAAGISFAGHGHTPAQIEAELVGVRREFPGVVDMSWADGRGVVLASTEPQLAAQSVWARDYFQDIVRGADWRVSGLVRSLVDGRPVFVVARALRDERGELTGVVNATVDPESLVPLLAQRSGGGATSLIDSAGTLVALQPGTPLDWEARRRPADHRWVRRALDGDEVFGVYRSPITGGLRIGGYVPVPSVGWVAHASRPVDEALAPVRRNALVNGLALIVVALAALAAASVVARRITEPLESLEHRAARVGHGGGGDAVAARGPAEVRRVARALASMAASVEARRAEVEEAQRGAELAAAAAQAHGAELEAVFAALPIAVVMVDSSHRLVRVNDRARGLADVLEIPALDDLRRLDEIGTFRVVGSDGQAVPLDQRPHARALRGEVVQGELLRFERSGAPPVWIAASAAPIRDGAGAIRGAIATAVDLTEVHALQEERETLMQTVSHDLRTPLHVVVGHAELLRRRPEEEVRRRAEAILGSARAG
jgi:PAS domain-containing protein